MEKTAFVFVYCMVFCLSIISGSGEQEERSRSVFRRNSGGAAEYQLRFAHDSFVATSDATVERLIDSHPPLLVHTREKETDVLKLVRVNDNVTIPLQIQAYDNLKAITHLPVSAVSILISEVTSTDEPSPLSPEAQGRLEQLQQVLEQSATVVEGGTFEPGGQTSRQMRIINAVSQFVSNISASSRTVTVETLNIFAHSLSNDLMENAREAVKDYFTCLNATITALLRDQNITEEEWKSVTTVVEVEPFSRPRSFLVQYYEALFNSSLAESTDSPRIVLLPNVDSPGPQLPDSSSRVYATVRAQADQNIGELFYGTAVPTHQFLSEAAMELICSEDFYLPSCSSVQSTQPRQFSSGFVTAVERAYVIVIIFVGTSALVLGITLLCIYLEGRRVKRERRKEVERIKRYDGPNVFSGVDRETANQDADDSSSGVTRRAQRIQALDTDSLEAELRHSTVTHSEVSF